MVHLDVKRGVKRNRTLSDREDELRREGCDQKTIDMYRKISEKIDPPVNRYDNVLSVPKKMITAFKNAA